MSEKEIIDGLLRNDKTAIRSLVNEHQKKVIKTAFYFVGNMEDAEDLSQEVFMEVLKSIKKYRSGSSLSTWIYRITVNKSLDHLRKQKTRGFIQRLGSFAGFSHTSHEPVITDPDHDIKERRRILESAINSLPENQRIAFVLNKYEELPYKEIAEVMNVSLSAVESHIHRAKMNLQKKLVNHFSEYASKRDK